MASFESYGLIGAVMVLMLWFYLSGLVILLGAEMNAEIEHASEYGKAPGEKVPGERRKIGPALQRAWETKHRLVGGAPHRTAAPLAPATGQRWSQWVIGAPVVMLQTLWTLRSYRKRVKS